MNHFRKQSDSFQVQTSDVLVKAGAFNPVSQSLSIGFVRNMVIFGSICSKYSLWLQTSAFSIKQVLGCSKVCEKLKKKLVGDRSTEAQARAYFKGVYEIFNAKRDSFHEIGMANNVVMQEKDGQFGG